MDDLVTSLPDGEVDYRVEWINIVDSVVVAAEAGLSSGSAKQA